MTEYCGDISCQEAWDKISNEPATLLVDVRTQAEWSFVGVADLSSVGKIPVLVEWVDFPNARLIADFPGRLRKALEDANLPRDGSRTLLFLCRSGHRSDLAAKAAAEAGLGRCFNIVEGFEGGVDVSGHRGSLEGWKVRGLPWRQN
ncbi:MAG: rhodanese-like domain-containing protein [Hyphomicrobiales bacterium]|nr:rhodanese-like domain-containing protein [Hyphomicrobiales bacterium]MCY4032924.1 rhodanese-like domain-containing protein [Hyphomicrobiales bacterium]MCY4038736.1 rhodanese-like domain-containing protein [Hyphomicrobiales bacterium]